MRLSRCLCTGLTLVSRLLLVAQYASGPGHLRTSPFPSGHFREHWFSGASCEPTQDWQARRLPPLVQRALETVKKNYESGEYRSTTEAELTLRKLVEADENCK